MSMYKINTCCSLTFEDILRGRINKIVRCGETSSIIYFYYYHLMIILLSEAEGEEWKGRRGSIIKLFY